MTLYIRHNRYAGSEKQLQHAIAEYLNYQGCYVWVTNAGFIRFKDDRGDRVFRGGFKGLSDIIGISPTGRFIALEVKKPDGKYKATDAQLSFIERVKEHGGIAAVVTSPEEALTIVEGNV